MPRPIRRPPEHPDAASPPPVPADMHDPDAVYDRSVARLRPPGAIPADQVDTWTALVGTYRQYREQTVVPAAERGVSRADEQSLLAHDDELFAPIEATGLRLA